MIERRDETRWVRVHVYFNSKKKITLLNVDLSRRSSSRSSNNSGREIRNSSKRVLYMAKNEWFGNWKCANDVRALAHIYCAQCNPCMHWIPHTWIVNLAIIIRDFSSVSIESKKRFSYSVAFIHSNSKFVHTFGFYCYCFYSMAKHLAQKGLPLQHKWRLLSMALRRQRRWRWRKQQQQQQHKKKLKNWKTTRTMEFIMV